MTATAAGAVVAGAELAPTLNRYHPEIAKGVTPSAAARLLPVQDKRRQIVELVGPRLAPRSPDSPIDGNFDDGGGEDPLPQFGAIREHWPSRNFVKRRRRGENFAGH